MIKTLTVAASTFVALSAAFGPAAHACDEDCAYEAQEAAYERAYEREAAREEAAEEGYDSGSRSGSARRRGQAAQGRTAKRSSVPLAAERQTAEPKPDPTPRTQTPTPRIKVAKENSSISTGSGADRREVAEDDSYVQPAKTIGCKTYLPSVGMTLSVPCD
jgi:flagellar biosynthesis/type III secretory pathway protein FliH